MQIFGGIRRKAHQIAFVELPSANRSRTGKKEAMAARIPRTRRLEQTDLFAQDPFTVSFKEWQRRECWRRKQRPDGQQSHQEMPQGSDGDD